MHNEPFDTTREAAADSALRDSSELVRCILRNDPKAIAVFDRELRYIAVSERYVLDHGIEERDIIGKHHYELFPDIPRRWRDVYQRCLAGAVEHSDDDHLVQPDGFITYKRWECRPWHQPTGEIGGIITCSEVITEQKRAEQALLQSEAKYRQLFDNSPIGIISADLAGNILEANPKLLEMFGSPSLEATRAINILTFTPLRASGIAAAMERCIATGTSVSIEAPYTSKWGKACYIRGLLNPVLAAAGEVIGCQAVIEDITERKEVEAALEEKRNLLESIWRTSPVGMALAHRRVFTWVNDRWRRLFGYDSPEEVLGRTSELGYASRDQYERAGRVLYGKLESSAVAETEAVFKRKDGSLFHGHMWVTFLDPSDRSKGALAAIIDVTERKQAQDQLKRSLKEKEVLLREIHHRVKNNLAVIVSLMALQSSHSGGSVAEGVLQDLQHRVRSMAVAHEKLYESDNLAELSVADYLGGLADHLLCTYANTGSAVALHQDIDDMVVDLDMAIPLGLLLTELLSNCLKHAFVERPKGRVGVTFKQVDSETLELTVRDDGRGMNPDIDWSNPPSMGLDLVDTFVEQLHGRLELIVDGGTQIRIRFPRDKSRA
jgi:PAS domain S-box-containing protein